MAVFMKKVFFYVLFLLLLVFLISLTVQALGVSPGRVTLRYVPNYVYTGSACFSPQNNPHLKLSAGGEFADNIKFLNVENNEFYADQQCVEYSLKMPSFIDKPGPHRTLIYAQEIPEEVTGNIFVVVSVEHQIDIIVPYPGKYLEVWLSAKNVNAGDVVPFTASITNKGNETVEEARGSLVVYDNNNNIIDRLQTTLARSIETEQTRTLFANWESGTYKEGNYHATVTVSYDGGANANATTNFKLGGLDVNLVDYSKEIILGGIKDFYVIVDSIWSEPVKNVRAVITVYNYSNNTEPLTNSETLTREIPPWGTETLRGYIDTSSLHLGTYDLKIDLFFENMSKEYDRNLTLIKEPVPPEAEKTKKGLFGISTKVLLGALGVVLLIVIIILITLFIPKKRKKKGR